MNMNKVCKQIIVTNGRKSGFGKKIGYIIPVFILLKTYIWLYSGE